MQQENTNGSIKAHSHYVNQEDMIKLLIINTMGLSCLVENFRSAAFFLLHTNNSMYYSNFKSDMNEGKKSLTWISGSGLEYMLNEFELAYNADKLRKTFYWNLKHV